MTRIRRAVLPFDVATPESVLFDVRTANPAKKYRLLLAERDGVVVGMSHVGIAYDAAEPGLAWANPVVHPSTGDTAREVCCCARPRSM